MEFTEEVFIRNFIEDRKILGEDAQYLYESIFSDILGENVSLDELINEDGLTSKLMQLANPTSSPTAGYNLAPTKPSLFSGLVSGFSGLFSRIKNKLGTVFAGLKGKSFNEILSGGLGWLKNPANMPKILGTAGGAALVIMILRALKKRKRLKEYKRIQQVVANSNALREDFEDEFGWGNSPESIAFAKSKNELIRECRTNPELRNIVFGKPKVIQESYFDY